MGAEAGYNISVVVPSGTEVKAYFAFDLANMMIYTAENYLKPGNLSKLNLAFQVATYIHSARQILADASLNIGSHYTLFIDSDMRFPPDALIKLLLHGKPMVGINACTRSIPPRFTAIKAVTGPNGEAGTILRTEPDSTGLEAVEGIGFGMVLIRQDVFLALPPPTELPWFWFDWIKGHEGNTQVGEDVHFCKLVREAGFEILVDHDLSKKIKHIGNMEFDSSCPLSYEEGFAEAEANKETNED